MDKFQALADPTRREILNILAHEGQLPASDISARFSVTPQAISQHLKGLREARLVNVEKQAQMRIYYVNPEAMRELEDWARHLRQLWNQRFDALDRLIEIEKQKEKQNG